MKNLKRIFTMALALVMLLGMMTVPAAANGFSDADEIVNKEAVAITAGLGLFAGADGKFMPESTVTRAQMATIIVKMLRGSDFNADAFKGVDTFPDIVAFEGGWAEGYINACVQLGVVAGYGDGTFKPGKEVTTAEALTMVINALGVDPGPGEWPLTYMAKAEAMKLYGDLATKPGTYAPLTRDQLAVIVWEGLQYSPEGKSGYKVPGSDLVFTEVTDAILANGNNFEGITEAVGQDSLASKVYEVKVATGFITGNQAAGEDCTILTLADGSEEYYGVETGIDMLGHYVTVYYEEQYKNDEEPGVVYTVIDESTIITVTEEIDTAKEYKAVFTKNYDKAVNGWYFDGCYAGEYQEGDFAISGYVAGQSAPEGTYVICEGQILGYIAPAIVTASRVTMVNKSIDNEYIMLSGVQGQLSNAEGDDIVVEYPEIAVDDFVTFINVQGRYVLTKMGSVTGTVTKHGTNEDGEIVITVDGKQYTDFGSANNNFVDDSSVNTLAGDIANVDYAQNYTFYLASDGSVVCYKESDGVSFNVSDTVYLLGSISTVEMDGYGTYNKNYYGRGIDMNGDEVMILLGTTRGTDKRGNGGSESVGSMAVLSEGFYTVKASTVKEEKEYDIQKVTAFNSNTRIDKPYTMSYTSGIGWNFTGTLTTSGRTYGKSSDTRFLVLDDVGITDSVEISASMSLGSCSVWLAEGQKMHCIISNQTNGTRLMEVCIIRTVSESAASEIVYVSQYKNTSTGRVEGGYMYEAYNAKNGDEREIMLETDTTLTPGFYAVSTGTDGVNELNFLPAYTGSSADTEDNTDDFYYYNFFYDSAMTAYDGTTIWTDGVVTNESCTSTVPVVDARDEEQILRDGVPKINNLNDIIALWTSQPNVSVSLDICYYSGGNRVSAIFVRGVGESLVDAADVDTVLYITSDPRNGVVTGVVVATSGSNKATYSVGDEITLDPSQIVLLDCAGACWDSTSCNGFFSIQGATPDSIKLKHLRATDSKGTMADHNVITGWSEDDQVATFDAHRALNVCGYYCYTTVLTQTEASFYLDLAGATDDTVTVLDAANTGIDSLTALKSAAQTAVAAPGSANGILVSYYMADAGETPDVIVVCGTDANMEQAAGKKIWMAAPGQTVYLPKGRTDNANVDDAEEKNGAFVRLASTAWSLDGTENGMLYTMSAFIPGFGVEGFYTVDQMPNNSIITLTYVETQEKTAVVAEDGVPQADVYFQNGAVLGTAEVSELAEATSITYISCTDAGKTAVVIKETVMPDPEAHFYAAGETTTPTKSGKFAKMMEKAIAEGGTVELLKDVTISERVTIAAGKPVTIKDDGTARKITVTSTDRAFHLNVGSELTITGTQTGGLTIQGCESGSVGIMVNGKLTMSGKITVSGYKCTNATDTTGGSFIYNAGTGTAILNGVTFTDNSSAKSGGVIYSNGILDVTDVTFTGNTATSNGGVVFVANGTATLKGVTASDNTANRGYDVYSSKDSGAAITLDGSSLTSGGDTTSTAAVYINAGTSLTLGGKVTGVINFQHTGSIVINSDFSDQSDINIWLAAYKIGREVLSGDATAISAAVTAEAVTSTRAATQKTPMKIGTDGKLVKI